jgi:hypothetical protein
VSGFKTLMYSLSLAEPIPTLMPVCLALLRSCLQESLTPVYPASPVEIPFSDSRLRVRRAFVELVPGVSDPPCTPRTRWKFRAPIPTFARSVSSVELALKQAACGRE